MDFCSCKCEQLLAQNLFTLPQSPALVLSNILDANHTLFREPPVHGARFPVAWSDCTPPESPWEQQVPANSRLCSQHLLAGTFQGVLWWCCSSSGRERGSCMTVGSFPSHPFPSQELTQGILSTAPAGLCRGDFRLSLSDLARELQAHEWVKRGSQR